MRLVIGWKRSDGGLSFMTPCGPDSGDDKEGQDHSDARYCRRIADECKAQWDDPLAAIPPELKDATLLGWCVSDKVAEKFTEDDFQDFADKDEPRERKADLNIRSGGGVVRKLKDTQSDR